ncbi:MAG: tetratricopeptide repeat protein [Sandaracinaceae bacterium]
MSDELDLDLPAPRKPAARKPAPRPSAGGDLDLDLPAPRRKKNPIAPPPSFDSELDDLDLPAPRHKKKPNARPVQAGSALDDLDLPAPRQKKNPIAPPLDMGLDDLDLPAPRASDLGDPLGDLDLPAPIGGDPGPALADPARNPFDDLDLPVAKSGGRTGLAETAAEEPPSERSKRTSVIEEADEAFGDLDLPMPKAARTGFGDLDLPAPAKPATAVLGAAGIAAGMGEVDLPAPADGFGDLDLPTPRASLPALKEPDASFGDLDLPAPQNVTDLPAVSELADLPAPHQFTDLPAPSSLTDLPTPQVLSDLPTPRMESADLPVASGGTDLPVAKGDFDDLSLPEPRVIGGGPAPMLEGDLDANFGDLEVADVGDDMEFADLPQETASSAGATPAGLDADLPPPPVAAGKKKSKKKRGPRRRSKAVVYAAVVLGVLVAGGASLGLTSYGVFGIYFFDQFMPGAGDPAQTAAQIASAEEQAASDRWVDLRGSLMTLGDARRTAGLNRTLLARSLVHESLFAVRFPSNEFGTTARASALRARLEERDVETDELALAIGADMLRAGDLGGARAHLARARAHAGSDPYVDLLAGELELMAGAPEPALEAFRRAEGNGGGARALWGVARATLAAPEPDAEACDAAVRAVLEASPHHGAALVALADLHVDRGELVEGIDIVNRALGLTEVDGESLRSAPSARAVGWGVFGRIQEQRGRTTAALEAYQRSLESDPTHVDSLLGAGRVLLGDRPADALARFESVLQAEGGDRLVTSGRTAQQEAQLGAARAKLSLDRVGEARALLEALLAVREDDGDALLWMGRAEEALDPPNFEAAEQHYRSAIQADPDGLPAYLALAQLFLRTDRSTDAGAVLEQASTRVPESAEMRFQLGSFELQRNRYADAIRELDRALELDDDLPPALFALGEAHRQAGHLALAEATFARLGDIDSGHPGLSLARGRLFEARDEPLQAVAAYLEALEESPDDMDLQLRLGAAQVAADLIDDAEVTLERVREERPNSAEAQHFMGRVAFARERYSESLRFFEQAIRLDASKAQYHLYVGMAAFQNGELADALHGVEEALERDENLGDAYWIRGELALRTGRPRDAMTDLTRARELAPERAEVLAALGEAHDQLREIPDAITAYEQAVVADDDNGRWYYRLGRLLLDAGRPRDAASPLARATLFGDAESPVPGWLADAHRLQAQTARSSGQNADAVTHYRRYLELAAPGALDRAEVRRILMDMGEVPPAN